MHSTYIYAILSTKQRLHQFDNVMTGNLKITNLQEQSESIKYEDSDSEAEVSIMPTIKAEDCVGCGACVDACPSDAITIDDVAVIDAGACVDCGACIDECPSDAIVE